MLYGKSQINRVSRESGGSAPGFLVSKGRKELAMRTRILAVSLFVAMSLITSSSAACPSADLTGDYFVNSEDFEMVSAWWLEDCNSANGFCEGADYDLSSRVDENDLAILAADWLERCPAFVTTWDTNNGAGTTVTLALAGTVNATINWGDGTDPNVVTTPGPHVHNYDSDGTYTVSVTGSVTAYNSWYNGGGTSERAKLVSVDNWGLLGFTSMNRAFYRCPNLVSVPSTSDGIEAVTYMRSMFYRAWSFNGNIDGWDTSSVTDMSSMFSSAWSFNGNIGGWDTSSVTSMYGMFSYASAFNQDIGGWDTSSVTDMNTMFNAASAFNQDLSGWCVTKIPNEPPMFDFGATSWTKPRPVWGTCP